MCVPLLLLIFLYLMAARNRQGCVSSWGFAPCRTAWLAAELPLHTSFPPSGGATLLSLMKSNGSSKSDSPCKGACFSSQHESEVWLQTAVVTAELCSRGEGQWTQQKEPPGPCVLGPAFLTSPLGDEEALLLQEHYRRFGKWFLVRSVGPRQ